jgi:uncharacterized protein
MISIPKEITGFLNAQNVASLCFVEEGTLEPYGFSCFYAFDEKLARLIFKSSRDTRHAALMEAGKPVAGTVLPNNLDVIRIQGIQLKGHVLGAHEANYKQMGKEYYARYPFARLMTGDIWVIQLDTIKMTDNKTGFGKKIKWNLNKETHEV